VAALLLSALGDTALLHDSRGFFLTGIFLFLLAHLGYTTAFLYGGGAGPLFSSSLAGFGVIAVASIWLVGRLWAGVERPLRLPVLVYAAAITVMVGAAYVVLGGPWPTRITVALTAGSVMFYLGDAVLAWCRFRRPMPHHQAFNLSLYWVGQLGIALATRWVSEG
jgi:uncharacterized membrane protein YhhN